LADQVQITFGADVAPAIAAIDRLRAAVTGATAPVARLRSAFDEMGRGWQAAVRGLVTGRLSLQQAGLRLAQSAETGLLGLAQNALSQAAAGPLAALFGMGAPAAGQGVGAVFGEALGGWLSGAPGQLGRTVSATANTAALAANTAAVTALTAALGGAAAAGGASALGGVAALGGIFAFAGGGIVPSAARGWALPNFPGARPALLHAREMVLPAPISEGLQRMIGEGGGVGADMHLHFHGPSDGPSVERWFRGLLARNPGVVRDMLRSNALTPRTL
jgi:hypothetical protein